MISVFEEILDCKMELVKRGLSHCELNYFIRVMTANKGLLELEDKEAYELLAYLEGCLKIAETDRFLLANHIRQAVKKYMRLH